MEYLKNSGSIILTTLLVCLAIFSFSVVEVSGQGREPSLDNLEIGRTQFLSVREQYYNSLIPKDKATEALRLVEHNIRALAETSDKSVLLAEIWYLVGEIEEARGEGRLASEAFTECGKWANQALKIDEKSSDAHRLLADSYMRLIDYRGLLYTMTKGPQALRLLDRAISLDAKNYSAYNARGIYYFNAPAIGGGSNEKALKSLLHALGSTDPFDNFITQIWLSQTHSKSGRKAEAEECLQIALELYPGNAWAKELLAQLK